MMRALFVMGKYSTTYGLKAVVKSFVVVKLKSYYLVILSK